MLESKNKKYKKMKQIICFQELGEMVQPAEDSIVVISNGLSISGEMVGVGGNKFVRQFLMRLLEDLGFGVDSVAITSMDLKFSNKGYNFMSITLSSVEAVERILSISHHPQLGGKRVYIKPALFQPRRNMSRPVGKAKTSQQRTHRHSNDKQSKPKNNVIFNFNEDFPEMRQRQNKW